MYYVYILKSVKDGNIYTGYCNNIKRRLKQYQLGLAKSTKSRLPLRLIYYEAFTSQKDALIREKYLKSGGKAKNSLKLQIRNSLSEI